MDSATKDLLDALKANIARQDDYIKLLKESVEKSLAGDASHILTLADMLDKVRKIL